MVPTAVSQIIEQIVNAVVSVVGAYMLLKVGKEVAAQKNNDSYGAAYAASGGTLGTVMGALAALLFLFFLFLAFRKKFRRQMERDRRNKTCTEPFPCPRSAYHLFCSPCPLPIGNAPSLQINRAPAGPIAGGSAAARSYNMDLYGTNRSLPIILRLSI